MDVRVKKSLNSRLKLIEGQVRGLARMIYHGRYCMDILAQTSAVCAALHRIEQEIMKDHLATNVVPVLKRGAVRKQREKITELTDMLAKISR